MNEDSNNYFKTVLNSIENRRSKESNPLKKIGVIKEEQLNIPPLEKTGIKQDDENLSIRSSNKIDDLLVTIKALINDIDHISNNSLKSTAYNNIKKKISEVRSFYITELNEDIEFLRHVYNTEIKNKINKNAINLDRYVNNSNNTTIKPSTNSTNDFISYVGYNSTPINKILDEYITVDNNTNLVKKEPIPIEKSEEIYLNYNELAAELAENELIDKHGKYDEISMIDEWNLLCDKYKKIILKHERNEEG